ncbi:MAG TPA: hypothetical protein VGK20_09465 [Candidatus Binatia bacterium]|jgi:hypothetical protein
MKKGVFSVVLASAVLAAASLAFAGAYGEPEKPEEIPAPPPAPPAPEVVAPRIMREFTGFLTDAETTRGIWAELGSVYAAEYHPKAVGDVEAVNTYLHASFGTELFEVGLLAPYVYVHQDTIGSDNDFGDLKAWAKVMPLRTENFALGGGLIFSFPTAGSGLGTDEYGFEPYLTFNAVAGPTNIRASLGYEVTTDPNNIVADKHTGLPRNAPSDEYDYTDANLAVLMPLTMLGGFGDQVVVRAELTHNHFMSNDADPVSIFPGADISFHVGPGELLLRPTLGIGINEAPDWQIGLGIAYNTGV